MATLSIGDAIEKLADAVEDARPGILADIYAELFPEEPVATRPSASDLAEHVRAGLEAEEIVDLWNVVFPADHNVRYDEEEELIRYNDEAISFAE